nr:MAG TPA: hypothetical protein [Crassvirales sp.]
MKLYVSRNQLTLGILIMAVKNLKKQVFIISPNLLKIV